MALAHVDQSRSAQGHSMATNRERHAFTFAIALGASLKARRSLSSHDWGGSKRSIGFRQNVFRAPKTQLRTACPADEGDELLKFTWHRPAALAINLLHDPNTCRMLYDYAGIVPPTNEPSCFRNLSQPEYYHMRSLCGRCKYLRAKYPRKRNTTIQASRTPRFPATDKLLSSSAPMSTSFPVMGHRAPFAE